MDIALYWNNVVNELNANDHTGDPPRLEQGGPTRTSRAGAMAHLALNDGWFYAKGNAAGMYLPTAGLPAVPGGSSPHAAANVACATVLKHLYPAQRDLINARLAYAPAPASSGSALTGGPVGEAVARKLINARANDATFDERHPSRPAYAPSHAYGRHRADPVNPNQGNLSPYWGEMPFFATQAAVALQPPPGWSPNGLNPADAAYLAHHREVRSKGALPLANNRTRTEEETLIGVFWAYDGAQRIGTPPRLYNEVVQGLAGDASLTEDQSVRLFALVNTAMADAGIHAWYYKYLYSLWRPIVGVREYDTSFGPTAVPGSGASPISADVDPFWRPHGAPSTNDPGGRNFSPNFPAYPSGHATFGAAALHIAALFLEKIGKATIKKDFFDDVAFDFMSAELDGVAREPDGSIRTRHVRRFESLLEAIVENAVSRVYLGVHWRYDGTLGGYKKNGNVSTNFVADQKSIDLAYSAGQDAKRTGGLPLGLEIARSVFGGGLKQNPAPVNFPPLP